MSSLDEIQSMINSAKDELAQSRKMKEQVEHETVQASSGWGWDKGKRMSSESSDVSVKSAKVCWSVVRTHQFQDMTQRRLYCDNLTLRRFLDFPRVECSQAKLSGTSPAANEETVGCDSRSHPCEQLFHCKFSGISRKNRLWQPLENDEFWKVVKRWKVRHCWTNSLNHVIFAISILHMQIRMFRVAKSWDFGCFEATGPSCLVNLDQPKTL